MQIKQCVFIGLFSALWGTACMGGISDWLGTFCTEKLDDYGLTIRNSDIKANSAFEEAKFFMNLCNATKELTGKEHCVKFTDVIVQNMSQAIQISKDYVKHRDNKQVTCSAAYYACKDSNDHILCTTADDSAYYEFVFDEIDKDADSAVYKKGIGAAYCKIFMGDDAESGRHYERSTGINWFGGTLYKTGTEATSYNEYFTCEPGDELVERSKQEYNRKTRGMDVRAIGESGLYKDDLIRATSLKMDAALKTSFGYTARYGMHGGSDYGTVINFGTLPSCDDKNINKKFSKMKLNLDNNLIVWLGTYIKKNIEPSFRSFKCDLAPRSCTQSYASTGKEIACSIAPHLCKNKGNPVKDVLTCYTDGKPITFLFDTLSTGRDKLRAGAEAAMQCMTNTADGVFDGKRCQGLDESQCNILSKTVKTKWDPVMGACLLVDANAASKIQDIERVLNVAALDASALLLNIGSANEAGAAATIVMIFTNIRTEIKKTSITEVFSAHTAKLSRCNTGDCVAKVLKEYFDTFVQYREYALDDAVEAFDVIMAKKLDLLTDSKAKEFYDIAEQEIGKSNLDRLLNGEKLTSEAQKMLGLQVVNILATGVTLYTSVGGGVNNVGIKNVQELQKLPEVTSKIVSKLKTIKPMLTASSGKIKAMSSIANVIDKTSTVSTAQGFVDNLGGVATNVVKSMSRK